LVSGQGCFNRTGGRCALDPNHMCDLQLIPRGRCSYGDLSGAGTCVWPHGAGRCVGNTHVGCLADAYIANPIPANAVTGPSVMCSHPSLGGNSCDMTKDPYENVPVPGGVGNYNGVFSLACQCDPADSNSEATVCGTGGGAKSICSDGDPDRDDGGYGTALGVE